MPDAQHLYDGRVNDAYDLACAYLQRGPQGIDKALFKGEYAFAAAILASQFPCIGSPQALTAPDSVFFDRAVVLTVAARLFPVLTQGGAGGTVVSMATADGTKETYAPLNADAPADWSKEAMSALTRVSCIAKSLGSTITGFSLVYTARSRPSGGLGFDIFGFGAGLLDLGAYPLAWEADLSADALLTGDVPVALNPAVYGGQEYLP